MGPQPGSAEVAFERAANAYFAAARMARDSAKMAARLARLELENTRLRERAAQFEVKATASAEARDGNGGGEDAKRSAGASGTDAVDHMRERRRARRARRRERLREAEAGDTSGDGIAAAERAETPADAVDEDGIGTAKLAETPAGAVDEDRDAPMESAEELHGDTAAVVGADGDVGALVPATPTAEVSVVEDAFEEGDVVIYCSEREEWDDGDFVQPGDVGKVVGTSYYRDAGWVVPVDFPHTSLDCCVYYLRLQRESEPEQKVIADGIPPKRLWSAIDHTGESPGQPESKARWHGQAVDGFGAQSRDYGTKFVNGNKGVG